MDLFKTEEINSISHYDRGLALAAKLDRKYAPALEKYSTDERAAVALYFLPHKSQKDVLSVTRPRVVKWYCPFADQSAFPSGHRYCINVYAGCSHKCRYCYAQSYEPQQTKCKDNYKKKLARDLSELDQYNVPPAPLHLSNSTDPCQPIELTQKLTLHTLKKIIGYRRYFTTITILTKNPALLTKPEYLATLKELAVLPGDHKFKETFQRDNLPPLVIEASLAFADQADADFYDPAAPSVKDRIEAIKTLRAENLPVTLRIDPLLPRNPLSQGRRLEDFGLPDAQSIAKLDRLVKFAADCTCRHIVYSVAKITQPRNRSMDTEMQNLKRVYKHIAQNEKLIFRGGSWRLPNRTAQTHVTRPFLEICKKNKIKAYFCRKNLIMTI